MRSQLCDQIAVKILHVQEPEDEKLKKSLLTLQSSLHLKLENVTCQFIALTPSFVIINDVTVLILCLLFNKVEWTGADAGEVESAILLTLML